MTRASAVRSRRISSPVSVPALRPRVDARLVEHLVGDPVADAGGGRLVEQERLHRRRARGHQRLERAERREPAPRVEAEEADRRLGGGIDAQPRAPSRRASANGQLAAVVESQDQLHEARRPVEAGPLLAVGDQPQRAAPGV